MTEFSHGPRVLLVDDQAIIGEALRRMLAAERDIELLYCADPKEAVTTANRFQPTVILQDLVMPDLDGLTLLRAFRENEATREVPMIVLSTKEEAKTKAEAFSLGANDYLVKLPNAIELIARIRHHSRGYIAAIERNEAYEALQKSERALAAELADAANYVMSLLPARLTGVVATDWQFIPSVQLGGDAFGYHWLDDKCLAIYLLDVCGHGVKSALMSISAMNVLRNQTLPSTDFADPGKVLSGMNDAFQMDRHNGLYFTMWYGVFNTATRRLSFASGGHPPAILISGGRAEPAVEALENPGMIIGGLPDMSFSVGTRDVPPESQLYVFSDGIYELLQADGTTMSMGEFVPIVTDAAAVDGSRVASIISAVRARNLTPGFDDDVSLLEIRL